MYIKYPLIVPVIGHGSTDIIEYPIETVVFNLFSMILTYNLNFMQRKTLLILTSIYHISLDIPSKKYNILISSFIHVFWLKFPIISKLHLLLIHTPMHYLKIYILKNNWKKKYLMGFTTSYVSNILINRNIENMMEPKYGKLWWIFPILPHVILCNKINNKYIKKIKIIRIFERLFNNKNNKCIFI